MVCGCWWAGILSPTGSHGASFQLRAGWRMDPCVLLIIVTGFYGVGQHFFHNVLTTCYWPHYLPQSHSEGLDFWVLTQLALLLGIEFSVPLDSCFRLLNKDKASLQLPGLPTRLQQVASRGCLHHSGYFGCWEWWHRIMYLQSITRHTHQCETHMWCHSPVRRCSLASHFCWISGLKVHWEISNRGWCLVSMCPYTSECSYTFTYIHMHMPATPQIQF